MKRVYVMEPKVALQNDLDPTHLLVTYELIEWTEGEFAIFHLPGEEVTRADLRWGDGINDVRTRVIDSVLANITGITSNDIIFFGGWA